MLVACAFSLGIIVEGVLQVPIEGSIPLFLLGATLHLFATTSIGIFQGTITRSTPQFALSLMLLLLPLQMLSGGATPRENMPEIIQGIMLIAPNTHFVMLAQAILYRGAGLETVSPQFVAIAIIAVIFFVSALAFFRRSLSVLV